MFHPHRLLFGLALALAACSDRAPPSDADAPPRAAAMPLPEPAPSRISLPVRVPMARISADLEKTLPAELWTIDKPEQVCAKPTKANIFGAKLNVTPKLKCHITGKVTRGKLGLTAAGNNLRLAIPLHAEVEVKNVAGVLRESANADAVVWADIALAVLPSGQLTGKIKIDYRWDKPPGIDFMGQRISLAGEAEPRLAAIIAKAEKDFPAALAGLPVRGELEKLWQQGFTVESLNRANPEAWISLKPQRLGVGRIGSDGRNVVVNASLTAVAQVHLGKQPPRPVPTAMPAIATELGENSALQLHVPVLAQYGTLEPVLSKALAKVAAKGIEVSGKGRVKVRFGRPTLYGTTGGRLALGLDLAAKGPRGLIDTKGRVWLTAEPRTLPGSEKVLIKDISLATAKTDDVQMPLLAAVVMATPVQAALEDALTQDFTNDYGKLMVKIDKALQAVKIGPFRLAAKLDKVDHGKVLALGQGLYMPVVASGSAELDYAGPRR